MTPRIGRALVPLLLLVATGASIGAQELVPGGPRPVPVAATRRLDVGQSATTTRCSNATVVAASLSGGLLGAIILRGLWGLNLFAPQSGDDKRRGMVVGLALGAVLGGTVAWSRRDECHAPSSGVSDSL